MTPRERIKKVLNFEKPDVLPWWEAFYEETIVKWIGEGLPAKDVVSIEWVMSSRDGVLLLNWPAVMGFNPYPYFGCYTIWGCYVPIDVGPIPRYKLRQVGEEGKYLDFIMETGARARRLKEAEIKWYSMPMFIDFPVKNRKSWDEYKKRLNPYDPRRYPKDWERDVYLEVFENFQSSNTIICFNGFYGFGAQIMGITNFNLAFYRDPELIHDMAEYWEYFIIETIRNAVESLKGRIDIVYWWEDMATKHGPCISPKLFREFLLPHYKKVTTFLKKNNVNYVMMDSDGNMNPLLELIIESGITGLWPLEVNSGMDAVTIRKRYGNKLFLAGNLDKVELAKGGDAMKKEVDSKVPILKEGGGYIPGVDHLVHVEFTLKRFKEYAEYLKKYLSY